MSVAKMKAELEALRKENAKLKEDAAKPRAISMKVSEKGALSVYGLGRFPVTLYKEQWNRLADSMNDVKSFIVANNDKLAVKPAKAE